MRMAGDPLTPAIAITSFGCRCHGGELKAVNRVQFAPGDCYEIKLETGVMG